MLDNNSLLKILTPANRFNNSKNYENIFSRIEWILKDKENSCKEYFVDNIFFNYESELFEIEIYDISTKEEIFICEKQYTLKEVVKLLNNNKKKVIYNNI